MLFNVPSFKGYGGLSGRNRDEQIAGARVEVAPYKKDAADFVLWKPSDDDIPGWDSPWGRGRPGWHIECSAMSEKHLGLPFDIHGGGIDLTFPHHENEIAQSCCAHGHENDLKAFSRYWMHNGYLMVEGEKMSKSLGNVLLVHDMLKEFPGEAIRYTLLSTHYRQPFDWTEEGVRQSKRTLDRMYQHLRDLDDVPEPEVDEREVPETVLEALCDDLNTPKALSALNMLAKVAAEADNWDDRQRLKGQLLAAGDVLGLLHQSPEVWLGYGQATDDVDVAKIETLLEERQQARQSKDFARADEIRAELTAMGITIEDTPEGPKWKAAN